jgi:hypothetical protein
MISIRQLNAVRKEGCKTLRQAEVPGLLFTGYQKGRDFTAGNAQAKVL